MEASGKIPGKSSKLLHSQNVHNMTTIPFYCHFVQVATTMTQQLVGRQPRSTQDDTDNWGGDFARSNVRTQYMYVNHLHVCTGQGQRCLYIRDRQAKGKEKLPHTCSRFIGYLLYHFLPRFQPSSSCPLKCKWSRTRFCDVQFQTPEN
jgi:hypothetical protein